MIHVKHRGRPWIPRSGLLGYWPLDEGSGTSTADRSGNGHTGTITDAEWVTGKAKNALDFNGSSAKVNVGSLSYGTQTHPWTIAAWINLPDLNGIFTSVLWNGGDAVFGDAAVGLFLSYGKLRPYSGKYGASERYCTANSAIATGQWVHVVGTYTGTFASSSFTVYVNGSAVADTDGQSGDGSTNGGNDDSWDIGFALTYWADCLLDDVAIWNRVLSPAEIAEIYMRSK